MKNESEEIMSEEFIQILGHIKTGYIIGYLASLHKLTGEPYDELFTDKYILHALEKFEEDRHMVAPAMKNFNTACEKSEGKKP